MRQGFRKYQRIPLGCNLDPHLDLWWKQWENVWLRREKGRWKAKSL